MIPVLVTFAIIVGIVLVPYWLFVLRGEQVADRSLRKRMKVTKAKSLVQVDLLQAEQPLSTVGVVTRLLQHLSMIRNPIQRQIVTSGLDLTVGLVFLGSIFFAVAVAASVYWITGMLLAAVPVGLIVLFIPYLAVRFMAGRRLWKFEEQFPEAVELIARALRAGHAFTTGLSMVADEMPDPVAGEFRLVYDRQAFGMQITDALRDMARRVPLLDARFFVTAVLTQRESGGNLAEVLDNLASVVRDRFRVKRQIQVISAHARMTGWVLIGIPPALATVLFIINPEHWQTLTGARLGIQLIIAAIVLQITGTLIIRKMVQIEY